MASSAREITDGEAINLVARNCGSLAIEMSDVAGYVAGVNERISANLRMLDSLEEVTTRLLVDQAQVSDSTDEARVLAEQARGKLDQGRGAIEDTIAVFSGLTDLVVQLATDGRLRRSHGRGSEGSPPRSRPSPASQHARAQRHHRGGASGGSGRSFAVVAAEVKKLAHDTRTATSQIAGTIGQSPARPKPSPPRSRPGRKSRSHRARSRINETVRDVSDIVALVDRQTDGIAQATGLTPCQRRQREERPHHFAADARDNGGQLKQTWER